MFKEIISNIRGDHEANGTLPPTVAPIRATNRSKGMFMLKAEFSASHVSARALKGVVKIKALLTTNAIVGVLNCMFPCQSGNY